MITIKTTAKVFGQTQPHTFTIDKDGTVRVWDNIAKHYTRCHTLSPKVQNRIRKLAKSQKP